MKIRVLFLGLMTLLVFSCQKQERLWRIQENGLYGFIDSLGNVVIEPQYKYVGNFRSGYACVITEAKLNIRETFFGRKDTTLMVKYGYIDMDNNIVIDTSNIAILHVNPYMYSFPSMFSEKKLRFRDVVFTELDLVDDRFPYQDEKKRFWGYKNSEGDIAIEPRFSYAQSFANGRAVVRDTTMSIPSKGNEIDMSMFNQNGVIDVNGNVVVNFEYSYISQFGKNKETWACILGRDEEYGSFFKQWVLIDENGKVLMPPSRMWDFVYNSDEGLYVGQMKSFGIVDYTFFDKSGNYLTDYDHDGSLTCSFKEGGKWETLSDVTAFSEGFAGIKGRYGNRSVWYFANKKLESICIPYDSVLCFSNGLAAVKRYVDDPYHSPDSGNWGYIDKKANVVIPYQFSDCGSFIGALAYFKKCGTAYDIEGYINKKGDIVWQTRCKK